MENILSQLNEEQERAITEIKGPILVLAGAGSGKTRVIVYRIAYLVSIGVNPYEIMAITFTNKAADEMKERVESILREKCEGIKISTFHSFCASFLRREISVLGFTSSFTIYDETDSISLIKECMEVLGIDKNVCSPEKILDKISEYKNKINTLNNSNNGFDSEKINIEEIYNLYQHKLKENNALDFDDLLVKTLEMLSKYPEVLEKIKYKYIHIDEYQDTNYLQYLLIKHLSGNGDNLFVVGDEDQAIYGWRGADIRNILQFEKDFPSAKVINLERNYRSTECILNVANLLIKNNSFYRGKKLWTDRRGGEKVRFYNAEDEQDEALFIAEEIEELINSNSNYSDCAVLFRTRAQSRIIEEYFIDRKIPYRLIGTVGFYQRKEIKDIICYLRLLSNPYDFFALKRIINQPRRGIGNVSIENLERQHEKFPFQFDEFEKMVSDQGLTSSNIPALDKIIDFSNLIKKMRSRKEEFKLPEFIDYVLEESGYMESLKSIKTEDSVMRIENLKEFKSKAIECAESNGDNLELFLSRISLINDVDNLSSEKGFVNLLTLHCAKGLEFANVFIIGLEEELLPHINNMKDLEPLEEERRLCYVGFTRAKDNLFLTCAKRRLIFGKTKYRLFSRFLLEILSPNIEDLTYIPHKKISNFKFQISNSMPPINVGENSLELKGNLIHFREGDKIVHKFWGKGQVVSIKEKELFVAFPSQGIKRFSAESAQDYLNKD